MFGFRHCSDFRRSDFGIPLHNKNGDYLLPVLNDAVIFSCTTGNTNKQANLHESLGQGTFINKCQLAARRNSCKQDTKLPQQHTDRMESIHTGSSNNLDYRGNNSFADYCANTGCIWRNKNLLQATIYTQTQHGKLR